ncbi:MAG: folylpolyglutamate synthase/dihydrofolate synthase family protein [Thermoguttaceae bacterium]
MSANLRPTTPRDDALRYLAGRIDYERTHSMPSSSEQGLKLDRMRELLGRLGDPQRRMAIVHVAGTKGKGSTSAMIAAMLSAAGYHVGLFTSPHLDRVEERIAIDARPCSADDLAALVELVRPEVEQMDDAARLAAHPAAGTEQAGQPELGPTYFEILTAIALVHFARQRVDAAVLEVGLGGRLDSTNVCTPLVSVITSISLDHTQQLGDTLASIAAEKAGIIKPGVPVVSGVTAAEPRDVIRRAAARSGCRLVELGVGFDFDYHPAQHLERANSSPARLDFVAPNIATTSRSFVLALPGRHQAANAAISLAAIDELRQAGWSIPEDAIRRGLAEIHWPARVELLARQPAVVLDAAHNAASIRALVEVLEESFSVRRRLLVFATTQGKDVPGMLRHLDGRFDHVIFTHYLENPRGIPAAELAALAAECWVSPPRGHGPPVSRACTVEVAATPADAWDAVRRLAKPDDLVCITGSFFLAAEMRRQIAQRPLKDTAPAAD